MYCKSVLDRWKRTRFHEKVTGEVQAQRRREQRELIGVVAVVGVAATAAAFAQLFRESSIHAIRFIAGSDDPTEAARSVPRLAVALLVFASVVTAAWIGRRVVSTRRDRLGITAVAAAARGEGPGPSVRASLLHSAAPWIASSGLTSIGRESAIVEVGGALGSAAGRWLSSYGPALAAAGIGAAFASAYHAPIAAVLYVEEHLRVRNDRRAALYTVGGAVVGHVVTTRVFGGQPILSGRQHSIGALLILGAIALIPAVVGSRIFLELRDRAAAASVSGTANRSSRSTVARTLGLGAVAALIVAALPLTAGNGIEALHSASTQAGLGVALSLALAKLLATSAALHAGAPGGAFSPSLAVSAGWALGAFLILDGVGLTIPGGHWDGMLVAMAIGVAVGLRSPLVAIVVIPEMTGDFSLLPFCALAVGAAVILDRQIDAWRTRTVHHVPAELHDADA